MPLAPRRARSALRAGIAACLAATAIAVGLAGPTIAAGTAAAAGNPPAATPTPPPLPSQAAVPAGDGTGRKIG